MKIWQRVTFNFGSFSITLLVIGLITGSTNLILFGIFMISLGLVFGPEGNGMRIYQKVALSLVGFSVFPVGLGVLAGDASMIWAGVFLSTSGLIVILAGKFS